MIIYWLSNFGSTLRLLSLSKFLEGLRGMRPPSPKPSEPGRKLKTEQPLRNQMTQKPRAGHHDL